MKFNIALMKKEFLLVIKNIWFKEILHFPCSQNKIDEPIKKLPYDDTTLITI